MNSTDEHQLDKRLKDFQTRLENRTPEEKKAEEERARQREAESHIRHVEQLQNNMNAPQRHLRCQPDRSGQWGVKLASLESKVGTGFTVALVGVRGNGKTQMAVEMMRATTGKLKSAKYCTAAEFFMEIKASYRKDSDDTEAEVIQDYRKPALLVIDEFGKRSESAWETTLLFELLNKRYNDMSDTILIDNRKKAEFLTAIGSSLASRMSESGGIIECEWESFR